MVLSPLCKLDSPGELQKLPRPGPHPRPTKSGSILKRHNTRGLSHGLACTKLTMGPEAGHALPSSLWLGSADRPGASHDGPGCKCILENRGMGHDKGAERRGVNFAWGHNAERTPLQMNSQGRMSCPRHRNLGTAEEQARRWETASVIRNGQLDDSRRGREGAGRS